MEDLSDILLYDIGGGILAVYIAFTLYHFYRIEKSIITLDFFTGKTWGFLFVFLFRSLLLSPLAAIGWHCNPTVSEIMAFFCPESEKYHIFAWGLIGIILINTFYIWYMFKDERNQFIIALVLSGYIMLTGVQRSISGVVLVMWSLVGMSILMTCYWIYFFFQSLKNRQKRINFSKLKTQPE